MRDEKPVSDLLAEAMRRLDIVFRDLDEGTRTLVRDEKTGDLVAERVENVVRRR